jgi:hypothetical protein
MLTILAVGVAGAPAHASDYRQMNIWNSGHCLDNATQDDLKLQMWSCSGATEQKWLTLYNSDNLAFTIANQRSGRCIQAPTLGSIITMRHCDAGDPYEQWTIYTAENPSGTPNGWYSVYQNVATGYCLTTPTVANGTVPRAVTCDPDDPYDRWHLQ